MHPPLSKAIPGAHGTVLAAACLVPNSGDLRYVRRDEIDGPIADAAWEAFAEAARPAAAAELARLEPEYLRDKDQVIQCAILRSDRQTTAGALLAPDFLKRFRDIFGSKLLVAVPNRFTIYIFPALASRYAGYGERVVAEYRDSTYPVSREVFELSAEGMKAVGTFEPELRSSLREGRRSRLPSG